MQRSAAALPTSEPTTPDGRSAKRVRLSNGSYGNSSPATPSNDQLAIQAALAQEEQKRSHAIERQAAEAGETRWVLSERNMGPPAPKLQIVHAGFAELDAAGAMGEDDEMELSNELRQVAGRMSFGKVSDALIIKAESTVAQFLGEAHSRPQKPQSTKRAASDSSSESEDEDVDSEEEEDDDDDPTAALIRQSRKAASEKARADRKAKKHAAQAESQRLAETRRKKEIKLNRVSSISSAGSGGAGRGPLANARPRESSSTDQRGCFSCGEKGHKSSECPQSKCYKCGETGHQKSDCPKGKGW
jgi:hypothetical protein